MRLGLIPQGYEGYDVIECPRCEGTGSLPGGWVSDCPQCDGEGSVPLT